MNLLAKHSQNKEDKSTIITLGNLAKAHKQNDPEVIDATIGMLYNEDGTLFTFQSVERALQSLTPTEKYAYASTAGSADYHEAVKRWVFQDQYDFLLSHFSCAVMATPGGSGAISNTFTNYLNEEDAVLLPEYMWGNYKQFAYENFASYQTYRLFQNGRFDLTDLFLKMDIVKQKQKRIFLVINDPCHNPTGYSMEKEEWQKLIEKINEVSADGTPFILLWDMAYIDYEEKGMAFTRNNLALLSELCSSVLTVLAFSASKTMGLYGLRVGAQIALSKDLEAIEAFRKANQFSSRAKWSTTSQLGMNLVRKIVLEPDLCQSFTQELALSRQLLAKRAQLFLSGRRKANLTTLPFSCGFFITIPCLHPQEVYERLVLQKIHVIPLENCLRVAIASLSCAECEKIPSLIAETILKSETK